MSPTPAGKKEANKQGNKQKNKPSNTQTNVKENKHTTPAAKMKQTSQEKLKSSQSRWQIWNFHLRMAFCDKRSRRRSSMTKVLMIFTECWNKATLLSLRYGGLFASEGCCLIIVGAELASFDGFNIRELSRLLALQLQLDYKVRWRAHFKTRLTSQFSIASITFFWKMCIAEVVVPWVGYISEGWIISFVPWLGHIFLSHRWPHWSY